MVFWGMIKNRSVPVLVQLSASHGVTQAFARVCLRAGIENLRFHDLRHAATRFFEMGLNPMQAAAITGHKTLAMLQRYTHLKAEDLGDAGVKMI